MEAEGERLQKALAAAGIASRRHAEELIADGRVAVNGKTVTQPGTKVLPNDRISVDGKSVSRTPHHVYVMLNKPADILCTAHDERGRRTVLDLVQTRQRVYPVGRLDLDSEGLLLLTNDGELTFRLLHPRHEIDKEYLVWLDRSPTEDELRQLREGVEIEGGRTAPAKVVRKAGGALSLTLHEGRKRQVRQMAATLGLEVQHLLRIRIGPLSLGKLKTGEWRELRPEELEALRDAAGLPSEPATRTARRGPGGPFARPPVRPRARRS